MKFAARAEPEYWRSYQHIEESNLLPSLHVFARLVLEGIKAYSCCCCHPRLRLINVVSGSFLKIHPAVFQSSEQIYCFIVDYLLYSRIDTFEAAFETYITSEKKEKPMLFLRIGEILIT